MQNIVTKDGVTLSDGRLVKSIAYPGTYFFAARVLAAEPVLSEIRPVLDSDSDVVAAWATDGTDGEVAIRSTNAVALDISSAGPTTPFEPPGAEKAIDCVDPGHGEDPPADEEPPVVYTIKYVVAGSGLADVTIGNETGGTDQFSRVRLPWTKTFKFHERPDSLYLSAQRQSSVSGTITCSIYIDGELVERSRSSGPHAVCSAYA